MQVRAHLATEFGVDLSLARMLAEPTVANLAALVKQCEAPADAIQPIERAASGDEGRLLARIDELSDAEVDAALRGILSAAEGTP